MTTFDAALDGAPAQSRGLAGALVGGQAAKAEWVRTGELVPVKQLARAWGLTRQALRPAEKRGEVFSLLVAGQRYFPREFMELDRAQVAAICKQLGPLKPSEKLVFWKRPHNALAGRTVAQALCDHMTGPQFQQVLQLATTRASQAAAAGS